MATEQDKARKLLRDAIGDESSVKRELTQIPYPFGGVSETYSFSSQEPGTSRDERNMRSFDAQTGRLRGAQRAGLGKYGDGNVINGANKVDGLAYVSREVNPYTWAVSNPPTGRFSVKHTGSGGTDQSVGQDDYNYTHQAWVTDITRDLFDTYYILSRLGIVQKLNSDGSILDTIETTIWNGEASETLFATTIKVDSFQNIFVATGHRPGEDNELRCAITCHEHKADGSYGVAWSVAPNMFVLDMYVYAQDLFVWGVVDPGGAGAATYKLIRYPEYQMDVAPVADSSSEFTDAEGAGHALFDSYHVGRMDVDAAGIVYATASRYLRTNALTDYSRDGELAFAGIWKLRPISPEASTYIWFHEYTGSDFYDGRGSYGSVILSGPPTHQSRIVIEDLGGTILEFEFRNDGAAGTFIPVDMGADENEAISNLVTAINGESFDIAAELDVDNVRCKVRSTAIGVAGDNAIVKFNDVSATITVTGLDGGRDEDKAVQGYGLGVLIAPDMEEFGVNKASLRRIWVWGGGEGYSKDDGDDPDAPQPPGGTYAKQPRVRLIEDVDASGLDFDNSVDLTFDAADNAASRGWVEGISDLQYSSTGWYTFDALQMRGAIDEKGRLYLPGVLEDPDSVFDSSSVIGVQVTGVVGQETLVGVNLVTIIQGLAYAVTSLAVPLLEPNYDDTDPDLIDFVLIGGEAVVVNTTRWARGMDLVAVTGTSTALREIKTIAFVNETVWRLKSTDDPPVQLNFSGGGVATYSNALQYLQSATGNGRIYFTDGEDYYAYNPKDDDIDKLVSENNGQIPKRARLMEFWRNRLVLARSDQLPGTWHMSRAGDVTDWDQYPQTDDTAKAVSGTTARAGLCPDSINAIVPYSDDLIWFGCDSSIWQMTGDPAGSNGEWDMITDEVGMSFGRPFCKDDTGKLWFFGSKGGLYTWDNGLTNVSTGKIRRRLRDIDLGSNYIRLVYNYADDGIHIFVCPFGAAVDAPKDHYFYDKRLGSFHIDHFGTSGDKIEPTAVIVVDGDAGSDRAILLGGGDGRVRRWGSGPSGVIPKSDLLSDSDDRAIDSYVLIGPIADVHDMSEAAMSELAMVLAPDFSGVHIEVFVTDTPDSLGDPVWRGEIHAGRNANQLVRVSGDSIYLRLRNATLDEHWALEKATAILSYGGQIRSRT